ncbi:hypothetical protein [Geobacter pickeringii]|nr:hypothetical protein [Geobacter pickeringii]
MAAPLVVEHLSGNVNEWDSVKPAGHGSIRVDETVSVRPDQGTGRFIIIRHEKFPVILGAIIEEIRFRKLRPVLSESIGAFSAPVENLRPGTFIELIEASLQVRSVEKRNVKETAAAFGTSLTAAD